jgi:SAM-dependent methyltransferase
MTGKLSSDQLFEFLLQDAQANFFGWDFSYIEGREAQAPLRWSYISEALTLVRSSTVLLDMDTGGGEIFSRFAPFPALTYATEAYPPNLPIAKAKLEPLGVQVIPLDQEEPKQLLFEDEMFDLILNRHGYYWAPEIARLLQQGGIFLTQQVGNRNDIGIRQLLDAPDAGVIEEWDDLDNAASDLEKSGLTILKRLEDYYPQRFYDVGAIVYQLKAIPWQIPDFTVVKYFDRLKRVHERIQKRGFVEVEEHRFLILAVKN